jgi:AAHS family 4-hydroxybenzoate transporter-like MFS transporter
VSAHPGRQPGKAVWILKRFMDSKAEARARTVPMVIGLGILIIMADGYDMQFIGIVATDLMREWSLSPAAFGAIASAALFGSIAGAVLAGVVSRRIGLRATLAGSLVLFGLCTLAGLLAENAATLMVLRFIAGIGLGAAVPVTVTIVDDHSSLRTRAVAMTLVACGQPIGAIVGGMLCAQFMPTFGWKFAFVLGGIAPLLLVPFVWRLREAKEPERSVAQLTDLLGRDLWKTTSLLWLTVFSASCFLYLIFMWVPTTLREAGASLQASVWAVSAFNFGGIAGAIIVAMWVDRYGPFKVMPALFGIAAAATFLLGSSLSLPEAYPIAFVSGFCGYGAAILMGSVAVLLYPVSLRTFGVGCLLGVARWGAALGPTLFGWAKATGMPARELIWLAAVAPFIAMLCFLALARVQLTVSSRLAQQTD